MSNMSSVQASKALLRKEIKQKILSLNAKDKLSQTEFVCNKVINLPIFKACQRISIYLSTNHEIGTELIIRKMFEMNKMCFIPRYFGDVLEMVRLKSMDDWETLPLTKWKIKQPSLDEIREDAIKTGGLDLVIVPGVAFTKDGKRLGHGKGYYDKFLQNLSQIQEIGPTTIGLAFKEQMVEVLPTHDHDVKLDSIICATE
ncbi:PREDICTED: 5-formyltetrahydrofolate cyclo-ligase [Nicrophorus vespilloides]|uniref:5-formyltetrahydrofolate cyclo-ligase n=1 Tax=Nicrophorus vespilloides TaxID=110193 RepID=A0ABM1MGM1_NICVS|nr:PREDICTED: 5-formyltetrahydrofolate cyclo-ligase [Nicrophorus vespilloides]XP_017773722.1 PREDICTED: 5-formyltetrahydrofolate cyclo-ligase [Nicrophorus vespilloides]